MGQTSGEGTFVKVFKILKMCREWGGESIWPGESSEYPSEAVSLGVLGVGGIYVWCQSYLWDLSDQRGGGL